MNNPSVTVIITAKNAERTLRKCLDSVLSIDYDNYKVLFINDGSGDLTSDILKEYAGKIDIITNASSLGPSKSRNVAANIADSNYIAFTDADCIVDRNWLTELVKAFQRFPNAASCGGCQDIPQDATHFERDVFYLIKKLGLVTDYVRMIYSNNISEVNHNASCNVIYLRDIFIKEGGFSVGLWPGEDVDLDHRLRKYGYKLIFNPKAKVYHYRPKNLRAFLSMMFRYGKAQAYLVKKYGLFRRVQILPLIVILIFMLFVALSFSGLIQAVMYISIISLIALCLFFGFNFRVFILSIAGFVSWNAGFFKTYLQRSDIR